MAGIFQSAADGGRRAGRLVNVMFLPLDVRDLVFLGHLSDDSGFSGVAGGGALAVMGYVVVLVSALAVLVWRYREVDL